MFIIQFVKDIVISAMSMLNSASPWILFSFAVAGVIHEFVSSDFMKKSTIGSTKITGLLGSTLTGMCLPICSCGTIPLGVSMYYSGAYLGPTLTFMTASPMINPIAILLAFGLLGKEIAIIYILMGFFCPMLIGLIANHFGGDELYYKPAYEQTRIQLNLKKAKRTVKQRVKAGLKWSFTDLAVVISKFTVSGMLIAGVLFTVVPQGAIQRYLGDPGIISLLGITVVAALMYVCAVGHIPFIAAIVASGAAPGVAITFLMAGCATNIAELLTIRKTIGKRAVALYAVSVIALSELGGYLANHLLPNFKPVLDYDAVTHSIKNANVFIIQFPDWLQTLCSCVMIVYACVAFVRWFRKKWSHD
ncbi:MAG: permease [Lachnospiraceae bacterium]|nr:permease [Candidatus Equihabitans merdae]